MYYVLCMYAFINLYCVLPSVQVQEDEDECAEAAKKVCIHDTTTTSWDVGSSGDGEIEESEVEKKAGKLSKLV